MPSATGECRQPCFVHRVDTPAGAFRLVVAGLLLLFANTQHAAPVDVDAQIIRNDDDARAKCPRVCSDRKLYWARAWHKTGSAASYVCVCDDRALEASEPLASPPASPPPGRPPVAPLSAPDVKLPSCSIGGTTKCPGCSVVCGAKQTPVCDNAIEGVTSTCGRNAACSCTQ